MDTATVTGPRPEPLPPAIISPLDIAFDGRIEVAVDASDIERGIYWTHLRIPVAAAGAMTLLYPKWLPGYHSPAASIELMAGLEIRANGEILLWRRDPVEVSAFHIETPPGCDVLDVTLQFLTPTAQSQGAIVASAQMLILAWNHVLLYPAGFYARQITVQASVTLAPNWSAACALDIEHHEGDVVRFKPVPLDVLVDSPVMAGRHVRRIALDDAVSLNLFAERADLLQATEEQIAPHRALIVQADRLFGARHFRRYEFLAGLSDELSGAGVEHHCCCEICTTPGYFTDWERNAPKRDVFAHEYVHSWNGKFRRGADSWIASFERPIGNSLMWVYEGLTQYWGQVLSARSGLWTADQARDALGLTAAIHSCRPGGRWRPMSDTTRDPIIASRAPLPWASWQRSEDYYSEGQLMWLDIDTLIRELTQDARSLDDFARLFFGGEGGQVETLLYRFEDVVASLTRVAEHDWAGLISSWLENRQAGTSLSGLERGGYRLVFGDTPAPFCAQNDVLNNSVDLRFSVGLLLAMDGLVQEVLWESPSFEAGITAGSSILSVNDLAFDVDVLTGAVAATVKGEPLRLVVKRHKHLRSVELRYSGTLKHPRLEAIAGARRRLDELLEPRS